MKVIFRPIGGLKESINLQKEFSSVKDMIDYVCEFIGDNAKRNDIYISYDYYDDRIGWEMYIVAVRELRDLDYCKEYGYPLPVGFCTFK